MRFLEALVVDARLLHALIRQAGLGKCVIALEFVRIPVEDYAALRDVQREIEMVTEERLEVRDRASCLNDAREEGRALGVTPYAPGASP